MTAIVFDYPSPPLRLCDVIFVFGGSHPGLWQTAAKAYHAGLGKAIIATGGHKPGVKYHATWTDGETPEAHVIRRELIRLGVPEDRIICEDRSTNSLENVLFAMEVYDFSSVSSILVVCKNYGVGRQCRTLRQQMGNSVILIPYPFDTEISGHGPFITRDTWVNYEEGRAFVLTQVVKIRRYGKLGHLEPIGTMSSGLEAFVERNSES
ncbi:MAG: YdcF family protein [Anaerolineae bacterium]|nr:YdcF family protein [Anaerolineae bacterium]